MISVMTAGFFRLVIYQLEQQLKLPDTYSWAAAVRAGGTTERTDRYNKNTSTWRATLLQLSWQDAVLLQFSRSFDLCGIIPVHAGHEISLGKGEAAIFEEELNGQHTRHLAQGSIWLSNSYNFVIFYNFFM